MLSVARENFEEEAQTYRRGASILFFCLLACLSIIFSLFRRTSSLDHLLFLLFLLILLTWSSSTARSLSDHQAITTKRPSLFVLRLVICVLQMTRSPHKSQHRKQEVYSLSCLFLCCLFVSISFCHCLDAYDHVRIHHLLSSMPS